MRKSFEAAEPGRQAPMGRLGGRRGENGLMRTWEYLIIALPAFDAPAEHQGASASVTALNHEGRRGWEAVGMTTLADGSVAVLLKRPGDDA
jgi:hypothetical protein